MKMSRLLGAVCACAISTIPISAHAIGVSGQGTWETTLQARDLDGNLTTAEAYYDTVLDITWLLDANAGAGSIFDDVGSNGGTTTDGALTWANANAWATGLDINGATNWRLPDTAPVDGVAFDFVPAKDGSTDYGYNMSSPGTVYAGSTASEMAHMFYNTLGNLAIFDTLGNNFQPGWGLTNTGPFTNIQSLTYWSLEPINSNTFTFSFGSGEQSSADRVNSFHAWAVHDGDVGAAVIQVPAAAWLFGSGLLGLVGVARKKSA